MLSQVKGRFLFREWPEGTVVFDRRFGNTHALDRLNADVLRSELALDGARHHTEDEARAQARRQLQALGLIEQA